MKQAGVCQGCFMKRERGHTVCPRCGWKADKTYKRVFGWTAGDVFEQRYLTGLLYCRTPEAAVWRVYDKLLGISCLALRTSRAEDFLYCLADKIQKSQDRFQNEVCLMTIKAIGAKSTLLFSVREDEKYPDVLKDVLNRPIEPADPSALREPLESDSGRGLALMPGTVLDGRYRILECIGVGGFGIVYLCRDMPLQRYAAVKEYFPENWAEREERYVAVKQSRMAKFYKSGLKAFYQEAQLMAKFIHAPHVPAVYDVVEANDTAYLAMEYVAGISIGREMRARNYRPCTPDEMMEIMLPVFEALRAIHKEKIIHSDISPGNIMRSEDGKIFLTDFGAAKYAPDSRPVLNAAFLKLDYAAMEQYRTAQEGIPEDEGPWTDVYALGATIYYLLTGHKPPNAAERLKENHTGVALPKACRLKRKKRWAKLLNHAMAPDISKRIGSVEELAQELKKLTE